MTIDSTTRALVVGMGSSGIAAVKLLKKLGAAVAVSDSRSSTDLDQALLRRLRDQQIEVETDGHAADFFSLANLVVVSPGVPLDLPVLEQCRKHGVPVVGEMSLAAEYLKTPMVAVTGTNGKSTVVTLLGEMFAAANKKVFVGGNIGIPLAEYVCGSQDAEVVVVEVSSFQLDTAPGFRPDVAVLLNISPDHLDRYSSYDEYAASKLSIFAAQDKDDSVVLNVDDSEIMDRLEGKTGGRKFYYGTELAGDQNGIAIDHMTLKMKGLGSVEEKYELTGSSLNQEPNIHNAMAAVLAARLLNCPTYAVQQALTSYKKLDHRMTLVAEIRGVKYVDDSKGTNIGAVRAALEGMDRPVVLIGGGRDKGGDYGFLKEIVRAKVKSMLLIGEAATKMADYFAKDTQTEACHSLPEAVCRASVIAEPGDVVLLSPACASFDMFTSYSQRGDVFRSAVMKLVGNE
ncbi:MAG: UDP-N-acetylmuramoyl-L-alanine--D-glutamate ligase [Proteobacteria bacterium]|nr:UDP-N-acetylmuramoyl-L-alanine--D-glutamate ligase [Pseudomonadota bacterium]MBU1717334.1 UDP-N-acetylmuramoyl-L-alanine--D-glutamate ligase [Pseudomonadota bacterium]